MSEQQGAARAFAPLLALGLLALALGPPGCRLKERQQRGPPEWQPALQLPDQTAPGELAEGKEEAFGLTLPRSLQVERRYPDAVFARGGVSVEQLATYLRERVTAKNVQTGPSKTLFDKAQPRAKAGSAASASERLLRIEVTGMGGSTELVVRDVTPPKVEEGLSEEERWRKHGLTPDGKVLDPKKFD